jgi:oxygen-dependent protoporphyrinogen oxidase
MIGRLDSSNRSATIIGAGISGLLIGHALKKKGYRIRILERSGRAGGLIETKSTPSGPAETAAHSLLVTPAMETFFESLGVPLAPVHPDSRARFIYRNGRMRKFPLTLGESLHTVIRLFSKPSAPIDSETATLAEWCEAHLGKPALDFLLSPFVTGVYAASPSELLLKSAFPSLVPTDPSRSLFWNLFFGKKTGRRPRSRMMAPTRGMGSVVDRLRSMLEEDIEYHAKIESIPEDANVILCTPASDLADLIAPDDSGAAEALRSVRYAPILTCTVFIPNESFRGSPPRGVGVLIPRGQGLRILGVLFNSSSFPDRVRAPGLQSFTVMLGGTGDPSALQLSRSELTDLIDRDLKILFHLRGPVHSLEVTRWEKAIPVYSRELSEAQARLRSGFCARKGRMVFSNFSKAVSLRGLIQALDHLE